MPEENKYFFYLIIFPFIFKSILFIVFFPFCLLSSNLLLTNYYHFSPAKVSFILVHWIQYFYLHYNFLIWHIYTSRRECMWIYKQKRMYIYTYAVIAKMYLSSMQEHIQSTRKTGYLIKQILQKNSVSEKYHFKHTDYFR